MELRQIKTFLTVAAMLSFNRAADRLHYAQSSVSAQVQSLEEELGVPLFDRLGRRVRLTEAGARLLPYAEKMLALADETVAEVASGRGCQGSLTIRIPESFGVHRLPPVIQAFHAEYPDVRLSFTTCAQEGLEKDLRQGLVDLAFLLTDSVAARDLTAEILGFESIVLAAGPNHPLGAKSIVHSRDLIGRTLLFSRVDCSYRKMVEEALDQLGVNEYRRMEFHSVETLKRTVMAGVGVAALPEIAVSEEAAQNNLVVLPWPDGPLETALIMVRYRDRWLPPALKAFMDVTQKTLSIQSN